MRIAGAGCCLMDYLYGKVSYENEAFASYRSKQPGDGGIIPGGLVFAEDLEAFADSSFPEITDRLLGERKADTKNLGGPAIVAMVGAAQILEESDGELEFYGALGDDAAGREIASFVEASPVKAHFKTVAGKPSASTVVLADPDAKGGKGERSFINTIGAAGSFSAQDLPDRFYSSDIVLLGGTALVPSLHDSLDEILERSRAAGAATIVGTVYDFRNQKAAPHAPWPLGGTEAKGHIDLLVTDAEEALRLTGCNDLETAAKALMDQGVGSLIITHGAEDFFVWSSGSFCAPLGPVWRPVSRLIDEQLEKEPSLKGDTTGCGDNFLGGVTASLALQLLAGRTRGSLDLDEAVAWGSAAGGFACFYHGGTYHQKTKGEKYRKLLPVVEAYRRQIRG
jgi:sugar/nucleoside kinase (ribokinase family)